jgi:TATA-binding protein-associated factor Taf7
MASLLIRDPRTPRRAGRSVNAARTDTKTTTTPATPIERMNIKGKNRRPESPINTAVPEKKMDRPAVATVRGTASTVG